jgi:hypothetical protein
MSDGAYVRSIVRQAAQKLRDAGQEIRSNEGNSLEDISAALNQARAAIDTAMAVILGIIQSMRDARAEVNSVVVGSGNRLVEEGMVMLGDAELDQEDMVSKLRFLKQELDKMILDVLTVAVRDKDNDSAKVLAAASRFEGYSNNP